MSNFPNELLWDFDHRPLRGATAAEMDEELRQLQRDPLGLARQRLRSEAREMELEVDKFLTGHEDLFEADEKHWLRRLFAKHTERSTHDE
jgi:hypothetical protein